MNAITTPDLTNPMHQLALRATASKHWRWLPAFGIDALAHAANLNARCRRAWRRGDAAALAWLAEQHHARDAARRTLDLVAALEAAP